jgi:hypothetical protein
MSCRKITSGRKKDSSVWQYFTYDAVPNKSKCLVESDGTKCNRRIAGKNSTNLMNHLKYNHSPIHAEVVTTEKAKKIIVERAAKLNVASTGN